MRILVVDDNELVRRGVTELLSSNAAWEVCGIAENGDEALGKAIDLRPDLVLLDISMQGMSGFDVSRALRRALPHIKIVIMSSHDPAQLLPRAAEAGADACIDKNTLDADLFPAIEAIGRDSISGG